MSKAIQLWLTEEEIKYLLKCALIRYAYDPNNEKEYTSSTIKLENSLNKQK